MKEKMVNPLSDIIMYKRDDGMINVEILVQNETLWVTQDRMAELFGVQRPAITKHLKNIFESGELEKNSVCSILERTAADGKLVPQDSNDEPASVLLERIREEKLQMVADGRLKKKRYKERYHYLCGGV